MICSPGHWYPHRHSADIETCPYCVARCRASSTCMQTRRATLVPSPAIIVAPPPPATGTCYRCLSAVSIIPTDDGGQRSTIHHDDEDRCCTVIVAVERRRRVWNDERDSPARAAGAHWVPAGTGQWTAQVRTATELAV